MPYFHIEDEIFMPAYEAFLRFYNLDKSKYAQKDFIRYLLKREKLNIEYEEKSNNLKNEYSNP